MASYSVAKTRDNLSNLIDKAIAGEEVIITRHGKPTASLSAVTGERHKPKLTRGEMAASLEELRQLRESHPPARLSYRQIKQLDQADYEH